MFESIKFKDRHLSFEKAPEKYDEYTWKLGPLYKEIAERELGETPAIRERCLQEMREWIASNPDIVSCRTDSIFLLRFLRVCKYKVPAACRKLESYMRTVQRYPDWFQKVNVVDDERLRALLLDGYCVPLPEKDKLGRQVLLFQTGNFDPKIYTPADVMRLLELMFRVFYDDEEVQVAGIIGVFEDSGITLRHLTTWTFNDIRRAARFASKAMPIRSRGWHRVQFPPFGRAILELTRTLMGAKVRERIQLFKKFEDINDLVNLNIFPKEHNPQGTYSWKEAAIEFVKACEMRTQDLLLQETLLIKEKGTEEEPDLIITNEMKESFRKLTVD